MLIDQTHGTWSATDWKAALFSDLAACINGAVDTSPFGGFKVSGDEGGHDSEFRCEAAKQFLETRDVTGGQVPSLLHEFADSMGSKSRRLGLVAHNLIAEFALKSGDYATALRHANVAFSCWHHDIHNHRLILRCKALTGAAPANYEADLRDYLDRCYCPRPFEHFETTPSKQVYICSPDYLTPPVADLTDVANGPAQASGELDTLVWNTPAARYVRRTIIAGEFTYCSALTCPMIQGRLLPERALDKLPRRLSAEDPHLVQRDFHGYSIYYYRSRVYAVPTAQPADFSQISGHVLVSYTLDDLRDLIAEKAPGAADDAIGREWFDANGLANSVVFGLPDPEQRRVRERMQHTPRELMMTHDNSCNISCPSCRVKTIIASRGQTEEYDKLVPVFLTLLKDAQRLIVSGSGDPFASRHFRRLLRAIGRRETEFYGAIEFPDSFRVNLMTNGLLLNRDSYEELGLRGLLGIVSLSMDSCRPEAFETLRRGSKWDDLVAALQFIQTIRHQNEGMVLISYFTVQGANYEEIPDFIEFCRKYRFQHVQLNMLRNFGAYNNAEFQKHNIGDPNHPEFENFLNVMRRPELGDPFVILGNAKDYRELALQGGGA